MMYVAISGLLLFERIYHRGVAFGRFRWEKWTDDGTLYRYSIA
jgi:hypothetical protein